MMNLSVEQVILKIKEKTGKDKIEIQTLINGKLDQLSGLISEEGAAYIVANELGIPLTTEAQKLSIKDLKPAQNNVEIFGKVMKLYELREFTKDDGKGKVASFLMGDETGVVRVTLWNSQTDFFKKLKESQIVHIKNAYVRENNGRNELHLSEKAEINIDKEAKIGEVPKGPSRDRKLLANIAENDNIEVVGYIVQAFDPVFYEVCPNCNKRVRDTTGKFECPDHGSVNPAFNYLINFVLDDGSDNVRVVCFKNQAQNLLKKTDEEILAYKEDKAPFESIKKDLLGNIIKVIGRVQNNSMFNRLEIIGQLILDADPTEELQKLKSEPKTKQPEKAEIKVEKESKEKAEVIIEKKAEAKEVKKEEIKNEEVKVKEAVKPKTYVEVTEDDFLKDTYNKNKVSDSSNDDYSDQDESFSIDDL